MAWQFYDSFNSPEAQGPMPCKRWVKRPDDPKYKLRKWRPEGKHSHVSFFGGYQKSTTPIRETQEYMAREYARWLAARDKIELPIEGTIRFFLDWGSYCGSILSRRDCANPQLGLQPFAHGAMRAFHRLERPR